jgi:hypothetical protein
MFKRQHIKELKQKANAFRANSLKQIHFDKLLDFKALKI